MLQGGSCHLSHLIIFVFGFYTFGMPSSMSLPLLSPLNNINSSSATSDYDKINMIDDTAPFLSSSASSSFGGGGVGAGALDGEREIMKDFTLENYDPSATNATIPEYLITSIHTTSTLNQPTATKPLEPHAMSQHHHHPLHEPSDKMASIPLKPTTSNVINSSLPLKVGKTNAPMLNYIYDAHMSNSKHYHHDHRYGPQFEDGTVGNATRNITIQAGNTAVLNCRIRLLQDKTVSWVRRKHDGDDLQLLTVGMQTYSGDSRYVVELQYPNNWRLKILFVNKRDEGLYECQISTHPPKVIQIYLKVNGPLYFNNPRHLDEIIRLLDNSDIEDLSEDEEYGHIAQNHTETIRQAAPEVTIVDEKGTPLNDKYYEVDSTIQLTCKVRFTAMSSSVVFWLHGNRTLNYDVTRGGISVRTDLMENGANSVLSIAKVNKSDSGNYSCSIGANKYFTTTVHVLNEESLAELYHGSSPAMHQNYSNVLQLIALILVTTKLLKFAER